MKAFVSSVVYHRENRPMVVLEEGDRIYLDQSGLLTVVEAGASKASYATMRCGAFYIRRGYIPLWEMNDSGEMIAGGKTVDLVGIRTVAAVGRLCEEQEQGTAGPEDAATVFELVEEALEWLRLSTYGEPDGAFVIDVPTDDPRFRTDPLPGVSEETLRCLHRLEAEKPSYYDIYFGPEGNHEESLIIFALRVGGMSLVSGPGIGVTATAVRRHSETN